MESEVSVFSSLNLQTLLVGVVILLLLLWLRDFRHGLNMPPGPMQWPIVGSLPSLVLFGGKDPVPYLIELGQKYGGLFTMKLGDHFAIYISDFDIMKEALVKQVNCFSDRPSMEVAKYLHYSNSEYPGFGFANGKSWQVVRKFGVHCIKDFVVTKANEERIQAEAMALVQALEKKISEPQDPATLTMQASTNVICSIIFGDRYDYDSQEFAVIVKSIGDLTQCLEWNGLRNLFEILEYMPCPQNYKMARQASDRLFKAVQEQLKEHHRTLDPNDDRDLLDMFLRKQANAGENAKYFEDENLLNIMLDLFIAGSDTTASTLSWAYLFLSAHPDIQEECYRETTSILGNRLPTLADQTKLPYVEATILEVQRIGILTPLGIARCVSDDTTLRGFNIPKGTWVFPLLGAVAKDERLWKNPGDFSPKRFLDESGRCVKPGHHIPFGIGGRICAGESLAKGEIFLLFTTLLQKFRFHEVPDGPRIDFSPKLGLGWRPKPQKILLTCR